MPVRSFVAVWPPRTFLTVEGLPDPPVAGIRLVPPERRHVTLRFLGDVDDGDLATVGDALAAAALRRCTGDVAGATSTFGKGVLHVPVGGLDALAAGVVAATAGMGSAPAETRPFAGHVTLARSRRGGPDLRRFAGIEVAGGQWSVDEATVVVSLHGRYEVVARVPLG